MQRTPFLLMCLSVAGLSGCRITLPLSGAHVSDLRVDQRVQREDSLPLELRAEDQLTLQTDYGTIEVRAQAGPSTLHARVSARGRSDEEARAVLARFSVQLERGPDGLEARLVGDPLHIHEGHTRLDLSASVDFVATVPLRTFIVARSGSGDLTLRGPLGALELDTGYGAIEIDSAEGAVTAKSGSGDVRAANLAGPSAVLKSGYGAIVVQEARVAHLSCESGSGDLRVRKAESHALVLSTSYGAIEVQGAGGAVRANSGSGDVNLAGVRGAVEAESQYGAVTIEGVLTELAASSGSGDVRVRALEGSHAEKDWKLDSGYGQVVLRVPAAFACTLEASTGYGEVECELPLLVEGKHKQQKSRLMGTLGAGGARVKLVSGSGDVALKTL
jgi:DUF4097 and DUF4098 domain-containing protein YvlB